MKNIEKIILAWGIFDIAAVVWYMGWNIYHGKLPIAHDIHGIIETTKLFGMPSLKYLAFFVILIYISLLVSGFLLIKRKKAGAIISYFQTPFRLMMIIPPSMFFILWPLKYLFEKPQNLILIGISLVVLSEICKLITVIKWHKSFNSVEPVSAVDSQG